jgi:hypothetical protein
MNLKEKQKGVFLDFAVYQQLLQTLEMLKATSVESNQAQATEASQNLEDLLEEAMVTKERLTFTYEDKLFLAVVPIEEVELIEQLENCMDTQAVKEALKETQYQGTIPAERVNQLLGW